MKPTVTPAPAWLAAAAAVRTNRPAPMIAPMPSAIRSKGPSVRLRPAWPSASLRSCTTDLVPNRGLAISVLLPRRRDEHRDRSGDHDRDHEPLHPIHRALLHAPD